MEIDFVIAWVDGSDKTWQESKAKYDTKNKNEIYDYGKEMIDKVNEYLKSKGDSKDDSST